MRKKLLSKFLLSMIFVFLGIQLFAQERSISGKIISAEDGLH
jgi:hypothetical protein